MPPQARTLGSDLVEIVRDFLTAHEMLRSVAGCYRRDELRFEQVQELVGDGEEAVLYRLKERSHALFRDPVRRAGAPIGPEELFDLAVGALFHEAMKFRENFYQRDSYGPRVRAIREAAAPDAEGLLREFEKILGGSEERLEESLQEAEVLLAQTAVQFQLMLAAHASNGFVTRFLLEHAGLAETAFASPIDAVLAGIHGSAAQAYLCAGRSYLESGFFGEALDALDAAAARAGADAEMQRLRSYALGMSAYLDARYDEALDALGEWVDAGPEGVAPGFAGLALSAVSRVGQLVGPEASERLAPRAAALAQRLRASLETSPRPLSRSAGS